jgi:hypothetical protein
MLSPVVVQQQQKHVPVSSGQQAPVVDEGLCQLLNLRSRVRRIMPIDDGPDHLVSLRAVPLANV